MSEKSCSYENEINSSLSNISIASSKPPPYSKVVNNPSNEPNDKLYLLSDSVNVTPQKNGYSTLKSKCYEIYGNDNYGQSLRLNQILYNYDENNKTIGKAKIIKLEYFDTLVEAIHGFTHKIRPTSESKPECVTYYDAKLYNCGVDPTKGYIRINFTYKKINVGTK